MRNLIALMVVGLFAVGGADAFAQDDEETADVTEYFMDAAGVEGDIISPNGSVVTAGAKRKSKSLIKVRRHFVVEMIKAVEDI